jgi:outer membrane translocation and assembly module TamA
MYITTDPGIPLTLGLRAAGTILDGDYPYFDAAFLGGLGSLRGFDRERFAGDASALGAAELRATLGKVWLIVPATLHLFGFAEAGRVFADGEESEQWHPAYGGGVALTVVEPANTISVSVGRTKEQVGVYVTAGFGL